MPLLTPPGFEPPGWLPGGGAVVESPIVVFENELAYWLKGQLGIDCDPDELPQSDTNYPLLTFTIIDGATPAPLIGPASLRSGTFQFDAWDRTIAACHTIQARLGALLVNYLGPCGDSFILGASRGRTMTKYGTDPTGADNGIRGVMTEYWIAWRL